MGSCSQPKHSLKTTGIRRDRVTRLPAPACSSLRRLPIFSEVSCCRYKLLSLCNSIDALLITLFDYAEPILPQSLKERVRRLLKASDVLAADIDSVADNADLYALGLSSHATVNLMLALEQDFSIEFPDRLLRRQTFSSVDDIADALIQIGVDQAAA